MSPWEENDKGELQRAARGLRTGRLPPLKFLKSTCAVVGGGGNSGERRKKANSNSLLEKNVVTPCRMGTAKELEKDASLKGTNAARG